MLFMPSRKIWSMSMLTLTVVDPFFELGACGVKTVVMVCSIIYEIWGKIRSQSLQKENNYLQANSQHSGLESTHNATAEVC
jgi:hypothetical protein